MQNYPLVNLSEFTQHLKQLRDKLTDFLEQLTNEQATLKKLNIQNLLDTITKKNQIAEELELLLQKTTQDFQLEPNFIAIKSLLEESTPTPTAEIELIDEIIHLSTKAHNLNTSNGLTISSLSKFNKQFLDIVNPNPQVNLYGATGQTKQSKQKNTLGSA